VGGLAVAAGDQQEARELRGPKWECSGQWVERATVPIFNKPSLDSDLEFS
jgi:hypothetical protein